MLFIFKKKLVLIVDFYILLYNHLHLIYIKQKVDSIVTD
jgi:hypothetical protein